MNYNELIAIDDSKWFSALLPLKRAKPIKSNPLIIGFDTEFVTRDGKQELLSIQFTTGNHSLVIPFTDSKAINDIIIDIFRMVGAPVGRIKSAGLYNLIHLFLVDSGYQEIPKDIYLISHFSQAELSNLDNLHDVELFQASRGLFGEFKYKCPITGNISTIHIKDLFSIFSTSLESVGEYLGIPKVSLDVGDRPESYWKEHMDKLFNEHPEKFHKYASRDAEICYHAYIKIREFFLEKYKIDILNFNTLPSITGFLFRKDYLKEPVTPTRITEVSKKRKRNLVDGSTKFYDVIQKQEIFDGDLNVRYAALQAYHGARVESFYRGRLEGVDLAYYDVVSLYPSSAMLQPLPVKDTRWFNFRELQEINPTLFEELVHTGEGFIEVEFSFPEPTMFPCLAVSGARDAVLYFPLNGIAYCTLSELRLALKLGLRDYRVLSGFAFLPGDKERHHPLKHYMEDMLELKNNSAKGSIEYELYKLLMNALVGKLVERNEEHTPLELVKEGLLPREVLNRITRRTSKSKSVGSLWNPEWASLILGKARALISEFVAKGAYFVSTDSVLLPRDIDISCDALDELRSVGSDLKLELPVTHGVLIRTRLYVLNPLEQDSSKQHIARHGVHCSKEKFLEIIRDGFISKEIPDLTYKAEKLTKYHESLRTGRALNSPYEYESSINLKWDGKRKLISPVENPFSESSWSLPLGSPEVINNKQRKPPRAKAGRKPGKRLITENKEAIKELYQKSYTQAQIAKELGLSKGYVSRVVKEIKEQGEIRNEI
jgi:hypothetical protein